MSVSVSVSVQAVRWVQGEKVDSGRDVRLIALRTMLSMARDVREGEG
jgi:hypothetical protein